MKNLITIVIIAFMLSTIMFCKNDAPSTVQSSAPEAGMTSNGQDAVVDRRRQPQHRHAVVGRDRPGARRRRAPRLRQ